MTVPLGPWPFSGRRAEVAAVLKAGQGARTVIVHGEHGAGRSRLVEEAARRARHHGPTLAVRAIRDGSGSRLVDLMDSDAPPLPQPELGTLASRCRGGLLLVDDAHLVDPALLEGALASGGVALTVPSHRCPSYRAERVALDPLPPMAVSTVLRRALGAPVDGRTAATLTHQSRGLLGSLVELTRGSLAAGLLSEESGVWVLAGEPVPTALLVEWVTAELARLPGDCMPGLAALALAEALPAEWLTARLRPECADAVLRCQLVVGADPVAFRSPLIARVVADAVPRLTLRRAARLLLASSGDPAPAGRARAGCRALAGQPPDPHEAVDAAVGLLAEQRPDTAQEILEHALGMHDSPEVRLTLAAVHLHRGAPGAAAAVLPDTARADPMRSAVRALGGLADDDPAPCHPLLDPHHDALDPSHDHPEQPGALVDPWPCREVQQAIARAEAGQVRHARELARNAYGRALMTGWLPDLAWGALALAWVAMRAGMPRSALLRCAEADRLLGELGWWSSQQLPRDIATVAHTWLSDGHAESREPQAGVAATVAWADLWSIRADASLLVASGRPGPAVERVREGLEGWSRLGAAHTAAALVGDLRRVGGGSLPSDVIDRLAAGPDLVGLRCHVRAAEGLAAGDVAGLRACAEQFELLGMPLEAAECLMAAARADAGRSAAAAAAMADEARRMARPCEGAVTPLLRAAPVVDALTRREREVASLAAAGRSSEGIAEQLGISRRTVDNLLGRAYAKLGVSGRGQLGAALGAAGPHA